LHQAVPLVCRRLRQLVHSPALLRDISLTLGGSSTEPEVAPAVRAQRLHSACEWLQCRAVGHVEQLELTLELAGLPEQHTCSAQVAAAIAACGAAGSLQHLWIDTDQLPGSTGGLLAARSLRSLSIATVDAFKVDSPLQALTALEQLWLDSVHEMGMQPGASLPPSLTRLHLGGERSASLPHQVRWRAAAHVLFGACCCSALLLLAAVTAFLLLLLAAMLPATVAALLLRMAILHLQPALSMLTDVSAHPLAHPEPP